MIHRHEIVSLVQRACDAIRDELAELEKSADELGIGSEISDHPHLREHRELADELDRFLAGEKRRVARVQERIANRGRHTRR
jgi:hypothetical protein